MSAQREDLVTAVQGLHRVVVRHLPNGACRYPGHLGALQISGQNENRTLRDIFPEFRTSP